MNLGRVAEWYEILDGQFCFLKRHHKPKKTPQQKQMADLRYPFQPWRRQLDASRSSFDHWRNRPQKWAMK